MSNYSKACCTVPPVVAEGYKPKGQYTEINGTKFYVTGSKDAEYAIFFIYDIFGYTDQTIQGADILAGTDTERNYQVFLPDFWEGKPADMSWYPPDSDEKKGALGAWFEGAAPPKHLPKISPWLTEIEKQNPSIKTWGVIGYCWGGKMVSLIGGRDTKFKAGVQTSPAMVDPEDASKVKIPMAVLASKEEPADDIKKYGEALTVKKHVETFTSELHGWMSARADLKNATTKSEYERGYQVTLSWFNENLHHTSAKAKM